MLTVKQENFCLAYLESRNASEAYRKVYNCENSKPASVNRLAKGLMDNVKIASRIKELQSEVREAAKVTLEKHLETLDRLRRKAEDEGRYTAAITAEVNRGKVSGLYVERIEHKGLEIPQITINRPNGD